MGIGAVIAANAVVTKHVFLDLRQPRELPMSCFGWRSRLRKGYAGAGPDQWALGARDVEGRDCACRAGLEDEAGSAQPTVHDLHGGAVHSQNMRLGGPDSLMPY